MTTYNVEVYSDMDNLIISAIPYSLDNKLPEDIEKFIYEKIKNKIIIDPNNSQYYILGSQFKPDWTYHYNDNIIHLRYRLYQLNKIKYKDSNICNLCY